MERFPEAELREARPSDEGAVGMLVDRVGWDSAYGTRGTRRKQPSGPIMGSRRSSGTRWPRPENPALGFFDSSPAIGWVIEAGNRIVGHLGSIPQLYQFGERTLLTAATAGFIVEPDFRDFSHIFGLLRKFFDQPGFNLVLDTTASQAAGALFRALRGAPMPVADYNRVLFWVTSGIGFAGAALRRLGIPYPLSGLALWPAGAALMADSLRRGPRRTARTRGLDVTSLPVAEVGDEFDELWRRKLEEPPRLMGWRTSAALKWHFHGLDQEGGVHVLCCRRKGELRGYLILARTDTASISLKRMRAVDMLVLGNEPDAVDILLAAAFDHARAAGVHLLELIGFPSEIRSRMLAGRPYVRRLPTFPYFYKARDEEIARRLENPDAWYACPYDGDASL